MKENLKYLKDVLGVKHLSKMQTPLKTKIKVRLMFIDQTEGYEDLREFAGPAGQLLSKMIEAMGLNKQEVSVVKGSDGFESQIAYIKPEVVVSFGVEEKIQAIRGKVFELGSHKLLSTFHPSYLLKNPHAKKHVWEDLKQAMKELGK